MLKAAKIIGVAVLTLWLAAAMQLSAVGVIEDHRAQGEATIYAFWVGIVLTLGIIGLGVWWSIRIARKPRP
jgi:formate-dependent nitrite reductase membrane component NrfD